ncbi:T-cell immunomodulatory protein-like [Crassostrea angulata]|uniref:T-cell immunomodulatory protein-like n=1 Tax=Magallana angulata TaxID=2784310 RepID=UPI0022B0D180|nr:T-cell immunomodulatory protein-like [Crassostrea angulata]
MKQFVLIILVFRSCFANSIHDVTTSAFGSVVQGKLAAFGDFNSDKHTDIFTLSDDGKTLKLFTATSDRTSTEFKFTETVLLTSSSEDVFTNVVPADFNGDTQMDLFVTTQKLPASNTAVNGCIYWGSLSKGSVLDHSDKLCLSEMLNDQPSVLDMNGDMIPDLMGENSGGVRKYWIFHKDTKNYTVQPVPGSLPALTHPTAGAFVDIDGDLAADFCMMSVKDGKRQLEVWMSINGKLTNTNNITMDEFADKKVIGQPVFADFGNQDSTIEILLPVCDDDLCTKSFIYLYLSDRISPWTKLPISFKAGSQDWGFVPPSKGLDGAPITLRTGDYNLDGFLDMVVVLQSTDSKGNLTRKALILQNIPCSDAACDGLGRSFSVRWDLSLHPSADLAVYPAFFDYRENGILDIILTTYSKDKKYHTHLLEQEFSEDANFLKIMVVSGLCFGNCPKDREPYGVNQYGPVVKYTTQDVEGKTITGTATQLSQSAYTPLQLPYAVFGLGQTPNFVDKIEAGIPNPPGTGIRKKSWSSIIPNSQLIVIPYPNDDPSSWKYKMFVTPSRMVMLTGATLLGTCGFIAGLVGILHWREKVEDKKEKLQEAHKFHFDAM